MKPDSFDRIIDPFSGNFDGPEIENSSEFMGLLTLHDCQYEI